MIFQIIDDKKDCTGVFVNGKIEHRKVGEDLTATWAYNPLLETLDVELANLYCNGNNLDEACPDHLKERWNVRKKKIHSFIKSFVNSKVNLDDVCFYDLVPFRHLAHYYNIKNEITEHVIQNTPRPNNYSFLFDTTVTVSEIAQQEVRLNWDFLKPRYLKDPKAKSIWDRFHGTTPYVNYDIFGTKTGRLGLKDGSFPILNFKRELRPAIIPKWGSFVELDYNAAEVRTLLSLSGKEQPQEDIHEFNAANIFDDETTREKAKRKFLAWLYNPNSNAIETEFYNRTEVLRQFYKDGTVETPFGRSIGADDFHALNYLLQSCSSDNCISQVNKIHKYLRHMKTNVAFIIHDSVVLDMAPEESHLLPQIIEIFEDTRLGKFPCNISVGKNLGQMVRL